MSEYFAHTRITVIKFTCQESLESMPDIYINDLEEAINLVAHDNDKLEAIRLKLINCRATVDQLQSRIWAEKNGYGTRRKENV